VNDTLFANEQNVKEYKEYVEMWVHEIKAPITVLNLLFSNNKNEVTAKMEQELSRIDGLVEQSLYYARSTSVNRDFQVKKITLKELVDDTLKQHAKELISVRASIEQINLDEVVYADSKWICFVLGQIILNSIKYRKDKLHLAFSGERKKEGIQLKISDNGIGICEKDLSRVFGKGFTGENGRTGAKSTGIGLYLCKKLCLKMNMGIEISSMEGTCVTLTFPVGSILEELKPMERNKITKM
jgi:signal transduction histidine kinase